MIYVYFITTLELTCFFFNCILNIGHVTSKHITYSSHEINKHFFKVLALKKRGGMKLLNNVLMSQRFWEKLGRNGFKRSDCNP